MEAKDKMYEEKHLQKEEVVRFKLKDGSQFGYKPMNGGEELDLMSEYLVDKEIMDPETGEKRIKKVEDHGKLHRVRLRFVAEAPYKDWDKKAPEERMKFLERLNPKILSEIISNINSIQSGNIEAKKK